MFKTLVNFRDLGGIKTLDGKTVKHNRILRSGELYNLCEEDKDLLLNKYNLKQIIDLRGTNETESNPDDVLEGVSYHHLDIIGGIHGPASKEQMEAHHKLDPNIMMPQLYVGILSNENAAKLYKEFIDLLINQKEGSSIFHCFAGKDRTGLAAAIILTILNVDKEDIICDFLKTIESRKEANKVLLEGYRKKGATEAEIENYEGFLTVRRNYIEAAFDYVEEKYGSFKNYVTEFLNVSEEEIAQLQELYLD